MEKKYCLECTFRHNCKTYGKLEDLTKLFLHITEKESESLELLENIGSLIGKKCKFKG